MVNIYDVQSGKLIEEAAKEMQKMPELAPPSWAIAVKTGHSKQRPPSQDNWWYLRSAAVLRSIYKLGPVGVSKLRTKYGGRKNRGFAPDKTYKGGGNILRKILQKLEIIGFAKQTQVGTHKGRVATAKGKSFLDKIATKLAKVPAHKVEKKEEAPVVHKSEKKEEAVAVHKTEKKEEAPAAHKSEKKVEVSAGGI